MQCRRLFCLYKFLDILEKQLEDLILNTPGQIRPSLGNRAGIEPPPFFSLVLIFPWVYVAVRLGVFHLTLKPYNMKQISQHELEVIKIKTLRRELDSSLQILKSSTGSRERSISTTKIQEAIMWLGMDLKRLGETNPYPNSYNPENTTIEPTADGLKL